jgi:hypothetical protein
MKKFKSKLGTLSVFCLLLILSSETVYGQQNGQGKTQQRTDSTYRIPTGPPKRITYLKEKGVFLTENQEILTLEKLQWKELYRQDAVTMYWVNEALQERVDDQANRIIRLENDVKKAESESVNAVGNMEHYRTLYKEYEAKNQKLTNDNAKLKANLFVYKGVTVALGAGIIYFAVKPLLH